MILALLLNSSPQNNLLSDSALIALIITIVVGLLGTVLTYIIFRQQQTRKILTYDVISDTRLASIQKSLGNKVEVTFEGKAVDELRLIIIKLWNSGNVTVKPDDFYEPIVFSFENGHVLDSDIVEELPENINASVEYNEWQVTLMPTFLNPKDSITIKILLDGTVGKINVKGRIVNAVLARAK